MALVKQKLNCNTCDKESVCKWRPVVTRVSDLIEDINKNQPKLSNELLTVIVNCEEYAGAFPVNDPHDIEMAKYFIEKND